VLGAWVFVFSFGRNGEDMPGIEPDVDRNAADGKDAIVVEIGKRCIQKVVARLLVGIGVILVMGGLVFRASLIEPDAYRNALTMSHADAEDYRIEFEEKLIDLGTVVREKEQWKTTITQSEINGWLADNREFSKTLPNGVSQPRISLSDARMSVVFRYEVMGVNAIFQGELDVFCTEFPGQIAFRIFNVRSGWIPLSVNAIADQFTMGMLAYGADVEWAEMDGDPVALVLFPEESFRLGKTVLTVKAVEIEEGKVMITGGSKSNR